MSPAAEVPEAPPPVYISLNCEVARVPHFHGWERVAIGDWEGIRVGGTLHLFGYFREVLGATLC